MKYPNNYQCRVGWLTGWHIRHNDAYAPTIIEWLLKAFEEVRVT